MAPCTVFHSISELHITSILKPCHYFSCLNSETRGAVMDWACR